jgi:hypothetical protein
MKADFDLPVDPCSDADVVVRRISGHLTEPMQQHYSTARGHEQQAAIARIIDLTRLTQRMGGNGSPMDSVADGQQSGQHRWTAHWEPGGSII